MNIEKINAEILLKRIYQVWVVNGSFLILVFGLQIIFGKYEKMILDACLWFFPLFIPILIMSQFKNCWQYRISHRKKEANLLLSFFLAFSCIYLLCIISTILFMPFILQPTILYIKNSTFLLYPIQLVINGLGIIILSRIHKKNSISS